MKNGKNSIKNFTRKSKISKYLGVLRMHFLFVIFAIFAYCLSDVAYAGVISSAPRLKDAGAKILSFLLSAVGVIAIIALVASGLMYFFSIGDENRMEIAKRSAKYSVVGVGIALSGMIIIRTISEFF